MKKNKKIIYIILGLIAIVIIGYIISKRKQNKTNTNAWGMKSQETRQGGGNTQSTTTKTGETPPPKPDVPIIPIPKGTATKKKGDDPTNIDETKSPTNKLAKWAESNKLKIVN